MMKKLLAILLALSLLALCACASKTAQAPAESETAPAQTEPETTDTSEQDPSAAQTDSEPSDGAKRVEPMAQTLDVEHLTDAMVAASFDENSIEEKDGKTYLTIGVYDYDLYDMVDIAQLAVGDTFVAGGKDIRVESIEEDDAGFKLINGGLEAGGVTLTTDENGVFYEVGMDDAKCYRELGSVTLEVAEDCTVTDSSDSEHPDQSYALSDLAQLSADGTGFTAANTTVTVAEGKIVSIARSFLP